MRTGNFKESITFIAMPRITPVNQATGQPSHESYLSDDSVLAVASTAKNKEKFNKLWSGSTEGYASNSEADLALCTILAFYANGNADQVDRLFRKSNLMRAKWNEKHGRYPFAEKVCKQPSR